MNDFTASNGVRIRVDLEGDYRFGGTARSADYIVRRGGANEQALREFFQAEADERLGRWRWPENPNVVVVPDLDRYHDDGKRWVAVYDETKMGRSSWYCADSSERGVRGSQPLHDAAWAYFDAHPEPKPWHDAGPAEVWDVDLPSGGMRAVTVYSARHEEPVTVFRDAHTQVEVETDDPTIRDARRIYPEVF